MSLRQYSGASAALPCWPSCSGGRAAVARTRHRVQGASSGRPRGSAKIGFGVSTSRECDQSQSSRLQYRRKRPDIFGTAPRAGTRTAQRSASSRSCVRAKDARNLFEERPAATTQTKVFGVEDDVHMSSCRRRPCHRQETTRDGHCRCAAVQEVEQGFARPPQIGDGVALIAFGSRQQRKADVVRIGTVVRDCFFEQLDALTPRLSLRADY